MAKDGIPGVKRKRRVGMKLHFWETRFWEAVHPSLAGLCSALLFYWISQRGCPVLENICGIGAATVLVSVVAIGFLLMSTILLAQKKKTFPVLNDMRRTSEYSRFMGYVSDAVSGALILIIFVSASVLFLQPHQNSIGNVCLYVYFAVKSFLEFRRAISILLMIMKGYEKA